MAAGVPKNPRKSVDVTLARVFGVSEWWKQYGGDERSDDEDAPETAAPSDPVARPVPIAGPPPSNAPPTYVPGVAPPPPPPTGAVPPPPQRPDLDPVSAPPVQAGSRASHLSTLLVVVVITALAVVGFLLLRSAGAAGSPLEREVLEVGSTLTGFTSEPVTRGDLGLSARFGEPVAFRSSDGTERVIIYDRAAVEDDISNIENDVGIADDLLTAIENAEVAGAASIAENELVEVGLAGRRIVIEVDGDPGRLVDTVVFVVATPDGEQAHVTVASTSGPVSRADLLAVAVDIEGRASR